MLSAEDLTWVMSPNGVGLEVWREIFKVFGGKDDEAVAVSHQVIEDELGLTGVEFMDRMLSEDDDGWKEFCNIIKEEYLEKGLKAYWKKFNVRILMRRKAIRKAVAQQKRIEGLDGDLKEAPSSGLGQDEVVSEVESVISEGVSERTFGIGGLYEVVEEQPREKAIMGRTLALPKIKVEMTKFSGSDDNLEWFQWIADFKVLALEYDLGEKEKMILLKNSLAGLAKDELTLILRVNASRNVVSTFESLVKSMDEVFPASITMMESMDELESMTMKPSETYREFEIRWRKQYLYFCLLGGNWDLGTQLHKFCKALDRPELEAFEPSTTAKVVELAKRFPKVGGGGQKRNSKQEGKFKSSKSESSGAKTSVSGTRKDDRATWKKRNITCFQCNQKGHYKNECPGVAKGSDKEESKSQSSSNGENESKISGSAVPVYDIGKSCELPGEVFEVDIGGRIVKLRAIFDSGSHLSYVNRKIVEEFKIPVVEGASERIRMINGDGFSPSEMAELNLLGWGIIQCKVTDCPADIILGWIDCKMNMDFIDLSQTIDVDSKVGMMSKLEIHSKIKKKIEMVEENVDDDVKNDFSNLLMEYSELFDNDLTKALKVPPVDIGLKEGVSPVVNYRRKWSPKEQKAIDEFMEQEDYLFEECQSSWNSRLVLQFERKRDGREKIRVCVDYRDVNKKCYKLNYPIPRVEDLLRWMAEGRCFLTLDLYHGYHQVPLKSDRSKNALAISVGFRKVRPTRLMMGQVNSMQLFQEAMMTILGDYVGTICIVYVDDIVVVATSVDELLVNTKMVFERLREFGAKISLDKMQLLQESVDVFGFDVSKEGIRVNEGRLSRIMEFPPPVTFNGILSFMGSVNYYRSCVPMLAEVAAPLYDLSKNSKSKKLDWGLSEQESFTEVKKRIKLHHERYFPSEDPEFRLFTDASNLAVGGVLFEEKEGNLYPVFCISRKLKANERVWSTIDQEALAIKFAVRKCRDFLLGRKFIVFSDHKPLRYLMGNLRKSEMPNQKLESYNVSLVDYDFEVKYVEGKRNQFADWLSRDGSVLFQNEKESVSLLARSEFVELHGEFHDVRPSRNLEGDDAKDYKKFLSECWCRLYGKSRRVRLSEKTIDYVWYGCDKSREYIGMDFLHVSDEMDVLVVVDLKDRMLWAFPIISSDELVFWVESFFRNEFVPFAILSDNGPEFTSDAFQSLLDQFDVRHVLTAIEQWNRGKDEW